MRKHLAAIRILQISDDTEKRWIAKEKNGPLRHIYPDLVDDLPTIQEGDEVVQAAAADIQDQTWISEAGSTASGPVQQELDPAQAAPHFPGEDSRWPDWETMRPQEEEIASPWPQQSGEMNYAHPSPQRGRSRNRDDNGHSETVTPDDDAKSEYSNSWG